MRFIPIVLPCSAICRISLGDRVVPYDSVELALIEAWVAGGNYILAMEPHYREALLQKEPKATSAWKQLGRTARWLQENIAMFRQPDSADRHGPGRPGAASSGNRESLVPTERSLPHRRR